MTPCLPPECHRRISGAHWLHRETVAGRRATIRAWSPARGAWRDGAGGFADPVAMAAEGWVYDRAWRDA